MKKYLPSLILLLLIHCSLLAQTAHVPYKDSQYVNRLEREQWANLQFPRPAVIVFHANSCIYSKKFEPTVEAVARKFKDKVDFYYTVDERGKWAPQEFGATAIPFILFVYGTTTDGRPLYTRAVGQLKEDVFVKQVSVTLRNWNPNTPVNEGFVGSWVGNNKYGPVKLVVGSDLCMHVEYYTYDARKQSKQLYFGDEFVRYDFIIIGDNGSFTLKDNQRYPEKEYTGNYHVGMKLSLENGNLVIKPHTGATFHGDGGLTEEEINRRKELMHEYFKIHDPYRFFTNIVLYREQ